MRRNRLVLLGLLVALSLGTGWFLFSQPPGYRECAASETRDFLVDYLVAKGFRLECRKEGDVSSLTYFGLRNFNQFLWWAGNQSIATIYEQPGYFWFMRTDMAPGFVTYEYR